MSILSMRIATKLPAMIVGLSVLSAAIIGIVAYEKSAAELNHDAQNMLSALNDARRNELGAYLETIRQDIVLFSDDEEIVAMEADFEKNYAAMGGSATETLKKLYIKDNPNKTGEKHKLDDAKDGSLWSQAHAHHHPWMREFVDLRGYYDVLLISKGGDVVYTVFKEADFAPNLMTGPWKDSGLGQLFRGFRP